MRKVLLRLIVHLMIRSNSIMTQKMKMAQLMMMILACTHLPLFLTVEVTLRFTFLWVLKDTANGVNY